jgi:hypothetical protein
MTDPELDRRARAMLAKALGAVDMQLQPQRSAYDALAHHGLLAVVLLCVFAAGFVAGAIWQMQSGL